MSSLLRQMILPTLLAFALAVSSCAKPAGMLQTFPPASQLQVSPEPVPPVEIVTSTQARDRFWSDIRDWARTGWSQVRGVCTWARERGMPDAPC